MTSIVTQTAIAAPASAAVLNSWSFDQASQALTITLPDGVTPDFFLLAQPARIVLEVPHTTLGGVVSSEQYSGAVRNIRLTEVSGGSRVVMELAPNTRLDPRHAELTATELNNGQTEWLLLPLLQDVPGAPVATNASVPTSAPVEGTATPPAAVTAPTVTSSPATVAEPASTETAPEDEADSFSEAIEVSEDEATAPEDEASAVAIAVTPSSDSLTDSVAELPEPPSLSDIATSATVGAVQALPTGPDPFAGVSTNASALVGAARDHLSDLPPEQLPIDPFAASSQGTVSVPSLAAADSTPAPAVSVPPLATVPDAPAVAQAPSALPVNSSTPPVAGIASNQVRPPGSQETALAPAAIATAPPVETTPTTGIAPNQVRPPSSQSNAVATVPPVETTTVTGGAPNQVRPPSRQSTSTSSAEVATIPPEASIRPPVQSGASEPISDAAMAANQVRPPNTAPAAVAESTALAAAIAAAAAQRPPNPTAVQQQNTAAVQRPSVPVTVAAEPPFLSSPPASEAVGAAPSPISTERQSIPPPPAIPRGNGTVPFGAPLPQTHSAGSVSQTNASYPAFLPLGTRLPLQYVGTNDLVLAEADPVYEVLVLTDDVYDPGTGMLLLPSGAQVLGRFEGPNNRERRFIAQSISYGRDRYPLQATSDALTGPRQPDGHDLALSSGIGAAAVTILAGLSGVGLLGGAAIGAAAGFADAPTLVTIAPGTTIEVEVISDALAFNNVPAVSRQYP